MLKDFFSDRPLSITTYGVLFILLGLFLFSSFSWLALVDIAELKSQAKQKNLALANTELRTTVKNVINEAKILTSQFSSWDETVQQLGNPTYYSYWREHRVPSAHFIKSYFSSIELYDSEGTALSKQHDPNLPRTIPNPLTDSYLVKQANNYHLVYIQAIEDTENNAQISGYTGLKIDFISALKRIQRFKYVNLESIKLNVPDGSIIEKNAITKNLTFEVVPNAEFIKLQELMFETLTQFALSGAALALLFWYLLVILFGLPSRQLSHQIDALRQGKLPLIDNTQKMKLPVAELEKVRVSLNDYQSQLDLRDVAIRENEMRMRAVLENVVDGIITIDQDGTIESHNAAANRIFGLGEKDYCGKNIVSLFSESSTKNYNIFFNRHSQIGLNSQNLPNSCELIGRRKDNTEFPAEIAVSTMHIHELQLHIVVVRDITERKRAEDKLISLANFDELTGLPNRVLFNDRMHQAMARAKRNEFLAAIIFIDLDNFKAINDTLGHHLGDQVLIMAAKRLLSSVREIDTVGRFGGDEFLVILESIKHIDEVTAITTKMLQSLEKAFILNEREMFVAASAGITIFPFDDTDTHNLVRNADTAMFRAKKQGGNTYQYYTSDMNTQVVERLNMENALRRALERNEFQLHYQPRIELATGRITGMEALLRWQHPELGIVSPVKFIPILEETGLIIPVGEWVLREACTQTHIWNQSTNLDMRVSVNLSMLQFRQSNLVESFGAILDSSHLPPTRLELEITEGVLVENVDATIEVLNLFHDKGIHISVDDFGTAYSSLSYLKRFPLNTLKIDRSFIRDINEDPDDAAITAAIVALARSLRLNVTAEGVETKSQLDFLRGLKCDEVQGFYFSKPLSVKDFEDLITQKSVLVVNL